MVRPRRSALYMPGSNARALDKARSLPADVLIFDLEDAVAPSAKSAARDNVRSAMAAGGYGQRERLVRINSLDTDWGKADVAALAQADIDGIVIPKVEHAAQILAVADQLHIAGATSALPLWCMIETPRGVLGVQDIAGASVQVAGLIMGTSDLSKELGATPGNARLPLVTSLGLCLLAAKAHGKWILDGVHLDLDDAPSFAAQCMPAISALMARRSSIRRRSTRPIRCSAPPSMKSRGLGASSLRTLQPNAPVRDWWSSMAS